MILELDFGKFKKSYNVINKIGDKALIIERSPAVLEAISRNPKPMAKLITESGVLEGLASVNINSNPVEVYLAITEQNTAKTSKKAPSSKNEQ